MSIDPQTYDLVEQMLLNAPFTDVLSQTQFTSSSNTDTQRPFKDQRARAALVRCDVMGVRFTVDGTDPQAGAPITVTPGDQILLCSPTVVKQFQFTSVFVFAAKITAILFG